MALVQRITHLSKLAFFLSLGIVAAVIDACSDDSKEPDASTGGGATTGQGGGNTQGGTATTQGGNQAQGGTAETTASGGVNSHGGSSSVEIRDAGLWDVICE